MLESDSDHSTEGPYELLARYEQTMIDLDADALAELYASDAVHEFGFFVPGHEPRYHGRDAIRAAYRTAWGAPSVRLVEMHHRALHETTDPEMLVAEWAGTARSTDGKTVDLAGVLVVRARDGYLVHVRDYMDVFGPPTRADGSRISLAARIERHRQPNPSPRGSTKSNERL